MLGYGAIVTEIATLSERGSLNPANFFSFFTVESNLVAVVILILSALALAYGKQGKRMAILRGANTLNMIVVGIVFTLLLSGLDVQLTAVPWDNIVLHYIIPVVVALDWFIDPPKVYIAFKQALVWMVFPIAYLLYSLIRGHFVDWYPYPFLNPTKNGYSKVALTCLVIAVGSAGLIWALARFTRRNSQKLV